MHAQKLLDGNPFTRLPPAPMVSAVPTGESDFLAELHRSRLALNMTSLFREEMNRKTSNMADARQKRGQ